jgi:tagatose 6-phosphate kinase
LILTVTLNAAVDKTYRIGGFMLDRVHRPSEWRIVAGGKGINVARVYRTLGGAALATGFLGGYNGLFIERSLREEGILSDFIPTEEESRVCIAVVDPTTGTQTEINEVGPKVRPEELRGFFQKFRELIRSPYRFVTLSGSIPPGVPASIYAELITIAHESDVRVVLDASGEALQLGAAARPWMVKPNIFELGQLTGRTPEGADEILRAAREIHETGIEVVCVTRGKDPCICVTTEGAWQAEPPSVEFVSAVGSGDSFLAAFLWAQEMGQGMVEALKLAVGAGAANAASWGAGFCTNEQIRRYCDKVRVTSLPA